MDQLNRPNQSITEGFIDQLVARLQCRLGRQLRDFHVQVQKNGLVLQGRASTYYAKQIAQQVAIEMSSLPVFANDIDVC